MLPIADRGAWINIDNLAFIEGYAPLQFRIDNIVEMCRRGSPSG